MLLLQVFELIEVKVNDVSQKYNRIATEASESDV